jgi:hypothetical protein
LAQESRALADVVRRSLFTAAKMLFVDFRQKGIVILLHCLYRPGITLSYKIPKAFR